MKLYWVSGPDWLRDLAARREHVEAIRERQRAQAGTMTVIPLPRDTSPPKKRRSEQRGQQPGSGLWDDTVGDFNPLHQQCAYSWCEEPAITWGREDRAPHSHTRGWFFQYGGRKLFCDEHSSRTWEQRRYRARKGTGRAEDLP